MSFAYDLTYKFEHVGYPVCGVYRMPDGRYRAFDGNKRSDKMWDTVDPAERWLASRMERFRDNG